MKAILVRVGVDHSYGGWNAPADPVTRRFLYVPIPEAIGTKFHAGCRRPYLALLPTIEQFASDYGLDLSAGLKWPRQLEGRSMHLDPDFDKLTYGDVGDRRGSHIREMEYGDIIVFYAGLRSTRPDDTQLVYALIGMYVVDEVVAASDVPKSRRDENAHTRKIKQGASDIVVRAVPGQSGRFSRFLPVGSYRNGAYRIHEDLLDAWGGLTVRDGFIQRSARPPRFNAPERFLSWLKRQEVELMQANNDPGGSPPVAIVLLRRPKMSNKNEMRTDPFWEFGSFGCTGCHWSNLMNLKRADELRGVRFGFAQGGPTGIRLVKLTPPVSVIEHQARAEVKWTPGKMPFRYDEAPVLIDNTGNTDFPALSAMLKGVRCSSPVACFSSKFRSRRTMLPDEVAQELVTRWAQFEEEADDAMIATNYADALPYMPPCPDQDRKATYARMLSEANREKQRKCVTTKTRKSKVLCRRSGKKC